MSLRLGWRCETRSTSSHPGGEKPGTGVPPEINLIPGTLAGMLVDEGAVPQHNDSEGPSTQPNIPRTRVSKLQPKSTAQSVKIGVSFQLVEWPVIS
jgi:hypothetical protein